MALWAIAYASRIDRYRARGVKFFAGCSLVLFIWGIFQEVLGPMIPPQIYIDQDKVNLLIARERWITYDPMAFNPYTSSDPDLPSMQKELAWIKNAGFTGIITFSSRGNFSRLAQLAKEQGLSTIIGVWNPTDRQELAYAIAQKDFVDGYCVGNNRLDKDYTFAELANAVQTIRFRTKKPVSTTEPIGRYLADERLIDLGDWIFPDVHASIQEQNSEDKQIVFRADAVRDGENLINLSEELTKKVGDRHKAILLKFVTYPYHGVPDASVDEQAMYFSYLLEKRREVMPELAPSVYLSFHSAFDIPWKTDFPFFPWDPYTGLLNEDGTPRLAAIVITKNLP
jgi:exo-beta-1,3-glucanase (GH17 family)